MTRVKICCIASIQEAHLAVRAGASAIGLVSEMPSGPGVIPESRIAEIAASVPPPIATVLLTSRKEAKEIVAQQKRCGVNTLQICDRVAPGVHEELRGSLPGVSLLQVVHVNREESVSIALQAARTVDALLLDSGDPSLPTPEFGGTGRTHDWQISARIIQESPVPTFLAGGLTSANVHRAIPSLRPFGVDVCTGVRTQGKLSERKLIDFMESVANAT